MELTLWSISWAQRVFLLVLRENYLQDVSINLYSPTTSSRFSWKIDFLFNYYGFSAGKYTPFTVSLKP